MLEAFRGLGKVFKVTAPNLINTNLNSTLKNKNSSLMISSPKPHTDLPIKKYPLGKQWERTVNYQEKQTLFFLFFFSSTTE